MLDDLLKAPPASHDFRPEKQDARGGAAELIVKAATGGLHRRFRSRLGPLERILPLVESHAGAAAGRSDAQLASAAAGLGLEIRRQGFRAELVAAVFALIREAAARNLGQRHFDSQLLGGWALLKGMVAEMETGEGKTLTATLAAGAAALAGVPVHVLTVNDYLTRRDAEEMGVLYRALGLSVGCVVHDVPVALRRNEYLCDITYCTNKEIVFDYLRDKLILDEMNGAELRLQVEPLYAREARQGRLLLRGLHYAIADEADSLLIDESRTPLIISGAVVGREEVGFMTAVLRFAQGLEAGKDFIVDQVAREVDIPLSGERKIGALALPQDTPWTGAIRKHEMVRRALSALHLFHLDKQYLIRDGKVQIIDPFTGRVMPDRSWEQGLQQLIEIKEGCEVTSQQEAVAKISYQRFFRRYLHLGGMTGTAREVAGELWSVYGLPVVRIPTHRPLRRKALPVRIFSNRGERDRFLVDRVRELQAAGLPVLIGTASVAASEAISRLLASKGLAHRVLNAKKDAEEARVISVAGERGAVTIATNMAGRGTDIKLAAGVAGTGGLQVILTELHEAARIDRQLAGRCGRQGDPGGHQAVLLVEHAAADGETDGVAGWLLRRLPKRSPFWPLAAKYALIQGQRRLERMHERMRRDLFKQDIQRKKLLSFSRREE